MEASEKSNLHQSNSMDEQRECIICYEPMEDKPSASAEQCPMHELDPQGQKCDIFNHVHGECLNQWMDQEERHPDKEFARCPLCPAQLREPKPENRAIARPPRQQVPGVLIPLSSGSDIWNFRSNVQAATAQLMAANVPEDGPAAIAMVMTEQGMMVTMMPQAALHTSADGRQQVTEDAQALEDAMLAAQIAAIDAATERHEEVERTVSARTEGATEAATSSNRCAMM